MHGISGSSRAFHTELMRELGPGAGAPVRRLSLSRATSSRSPTSGRSRLRIELFRRPQSHSRQGTELSSWVRAFDDALDSQEEQACKTSTSTATAFRSTR